MNSAVIRPRAADEHRARLLDGLAQALEAKPYREITVADIVQAARVSKRTFYEQFEAKEDCLLALCERTAELALELIAAHYNPAQDWQEQVRRVIDAYFAQMQAQPVLVRTLFIEILSLGDRGLAVRRGINQRFAEFLCAQVELERSRGVNKRPLHPQIAMAVVGGFHELVLQAVEENRVERLTEVTDAAYELVQAVLCNLMLE